MNTYVVTKICRQCSRVTVIPIEKSAKSAGTKKRHYCITGNLPQLYPQMVIGLELENTDVRDCMRMVDYRVELSKRNSEILQKHNVTESEYAEILRKHRSLFCEGLSWEDVQVEIDRVYDKLSFHDADRIHKSVVNNATDNLRLNAINRNIIMTGRQHKKIVYSMNEFFHFFDSVEKQGAYGKLVIPLKKQCLQAKCYGVNGNMVCDVEMKEKEDFVRRNIIERVRSGNRYQLLRTYEIDSFIREKQYSGLADEQLNVINCLYSSVPCIVTGGAGTGKTSVIRTLIECYARYYGERHILLTAPTGKASRRLAEKTGMPACTIHKALRKSIEDNYTYYNENHQLPHRLIIVDESSMIDTSLMYDLLKATNMATKIVFVGDCNQLSPVGYGEPFFQFMNVMDIYYLRQNHRQSEDTDILKMANLALRGRRIRNGRGVSVQSIECSEIPDILKNYLCGKNFPEDLQVISPFNGLNEKINLCVQEKRAGKKNENGEFLFSVGDKIMTLRNTKDYCNGDIGFVTAIDKTSITLQIDGKKVVVPMKNRDDISLAYAITVHKMQGSESDRVIVFLPEDEYILGNRMLYTAFTRAKNELLIYYYH